MDTKSKSGYAVISMEIDTRLKLRMESLKIVPLESSGGSSPFNECLTSLWTNPEAVLN